MEELVLPKWGATMQEATLTEWFVNVGDHVNEGQPVASVETEKVDGEIEAPVSGVITKILIGAGSVVPVSTVLATIEKD